MGFVAAHLRAQVGLVIFRDLAGYGGGAGPHDGVDQVAADGVGHVPSGGIADVCSAVADIAAGGIGDAFRIPGGGGIITVGRFDAVGLHSYLVVANLVDDAVGPGVDNIGCTVADGTAGCGVGDTVGIHYALHCRPVTDLAGDAVGRLVDQGFRIIGDGPVGSGVGDVDVGLFHAGAAVGTLDLLQDLIDSLPEGGGIVTIFVAQDTAGFRSALGGRIGVLIRIGQRALALGGSLGGQVAVLFRIDNLGSHTAAFYSQGTLQLPSVSVALAQVEVPFSS